MLKLDRMGLLAIHSDSPFMRPRSHYVPWRLPAALG
jgi:hypothetical protein